MSARTAGVVRAFGWIESISASPQLQTCQGVRSARRTPQSPNRPDPNNVPLPNTGTTSGTTAGTGTGTGTTSGTTGSIGTGTTGGTGTGGSGTGTGAK